MENCNHMRGSVLTICIALASVTACGGGGSTSPDSTGGGTSTDGLPVPVNGIVARVGRFFDPGSLTVSVNTTVSFVFESVGHNVIFAAVAGSPADIPGTNSSTTITRTFTTAGTFSYQCTIHAGMTGTVIVH
jgi:plastocyanin